ncbi:MAG: hypothetical protein ACH346_06840 [Chthoniobacterales bacterium]
MKKLLFLLLTFLLGFPVASIFAAETALSAIQVLRDASRPELLAGLAEVKGEHGDPQPAEWILLCNDPTAQGGVRELTISNHQIVSERTPLNGFGGEGDLLHLDTTHITVDSGAIFKAVNSEAIAHHIGFDAIDYVLRTDAISGATLWIVHLYNGSGALVGTMQLSSETGAVIKPLNGEKLKS